MGYSARIDADSFIYIVAWNNKEETDPQVVLRAIDDMMVEMMVTIEADSYLGVFSPKKTFRNSIAEDYKANRPETPEWVTRWKQIIIDHCIKEYGFVIAEDHEADDVLSIMRGEDVILCHIDKDLNQIPGKHYNYSKKTTYEINPLQAVYNFWTQVLVGDSTDNIKGCRLIGPIKATKAFSEVVDDSQFESITKGLFKKQNGESWLEDYEKTVSLIRLLQPTPELIEYYISHIHKVGREPDKDLVEDILNHDNSRVS